MTDPDKLTELASLLEQNELFAEQAIERDHEFLNIVQAFQDAVDADEVPAELVNLYAQLPRMIGERLESLERAVSITHREIQLHQTGASSVRASALRNMAKHLEAAATVAKVAEALERLHQSLHNAFPCPDEPSPENQET